MVLKIRMGKWKFIFGYSNQASHEWKDSSVGSCGKSSVGILPEFQDFGIFLENQEFFWLAESGGRGRIRTDERTKRADLQSASFSHLDTLPAKEMNLSRPFLVASR